MNTELHEVLSNNPSLQRLPVNTRGIDWFVGDVHGQLDMLFIALEAANFDPASDRLIGVGDLVDRGLRSFDVLKFFATNPWAFCTLGNHEVMALRGIHGQKRGYLSNEYWRLLLTIQEQREAVEYISNFPIALEVPLSDGRRVGVIHAELPPLAPWSIVEEAKVTDQDFHDDTERSLIACLLWSRRHFLLAESARWDPEARSVVRSDRLRASILLKPIQGIDLVISGHSTLQEDYRPLQVANRLYIDSGSGYSDGRLTLVNPRDKVYVQVHANRAQLHNIPEPLDLSKFVLPKEEMDAGISSLKAQGSYENLLFQCE